MSEILFDREGLNVASIARPGGPRLSFAIEGTAAVLSNDDARELRRILGLWLATWTESPRGTR